MEALIKRLQEVKQAILGLKEENAQLNSALEKRDKEISRLKKLLDIQNSSIKDLEQKLKMKRMADELNGDESESGTNRDLKFKINEMIKEVDKIISLMHQ
jgi:predicted nuclease with TOPRIM domain